QNKHSEERTADKELPLSSEEQALHDELVSLMHQESIAKVHNDAQRNAFEKEKRRITLEKGKESATSTLTRSTANTPSQSTVTLPSKVFTFMRKNSPKFSGRITSLTPPMLEVITALAAEEAHSESTHSRVEGSPRDAPGTPTQSAAQASSLQGTADLQGAADILQSPNDYTPTYESQTSRGDEGLLDLYALNREVRRLKKQSISQDKQIHKLKAKLKKLSKGVKPLVKHHLLWVKSQKLKKRGKKQKKKVSSVKLERNKDEGNFSEEHHDQDDHTAFVYEDSDATDVVVTPDLERKSDETE
ncbi:hypothetical protein Tco_0062669, partial [Tanacetum coccineum]